MKKIWPHLFILLVVLTFFRLFFFKGLLPIPSDDIIGLYHPFRDLYASSYARGYPYKNFLITDPVRQQYPWRNLAIQLEKQFSLPLWNPYNASGTPLLANQQSAPFYPLNLLFFLAPFPIAWSLIIFLQPLLSGCFLYLYLRNLKLEKISAIFGAITFAFCGFAVAWMEWGTIISTLLWLPLLLLSVDKLFQDKKRYLWGLLLLFAYCSSFLAGHVQTFFYLSIVLFAYVLLRVFQHKQIQPIFIMGGSVILFALLTAIQWIPLLQFIQLSARSVDISVGFGWFIPWQHIVQFIAPDFFGNPTTLNYWSIFNYAEFVGYIGIAPLVLVFYSLFSERNSTKFFFWSIAILAFLFAFPTIFANLPTTFKIPFLSTAQPTRLMAIIDFALSVLAAYGMEACIKSGKKLFIPIGIVGIFLVGIWASVLLHVRLFPQITPENIEIAKHNIYFPTLLFVLTVILLMAIPISKKFTRKGVLIVCMLLLFLTTFDLLRFGDKFEPFVSKNYLYPQDKLLAFLANNTHNQRIMSVDPRILPPNFSLMYSLQSVEVYDPLYVRTYGELIAASERSSADIHPPFGFNRIITPINYQSPMMNLLGVKYILSLYEISSPTYKKVFTEGETKVYENTRVFPRAFFVKHIISTTAKQDAINKVFANKNNLDNTAIVLRPLSTTLSLGNVIITQYTPNTVVLETKNTGPGFVVLTDVDYPTWHVSVDGKQAAIYQTDYTLRGVYVPKGVHTVAFSDKLF